MRKSITLIVGLLAVGFMHAQFIETTSSFGISVTNNGTFHGSGCAFVDFDNDGWDDLTFAAKNQAMKFYRNVNGTFQSYTMSFTPALATTVDVKCPLWVDYDNDGDKDLFITSINSPLRIYNNNGNMVFTDVATQIGIPSEIAFTMGISAGDFNNDGCLDFFVCKYHNGAIFTDYPYANHLFQNNCDGTFTDVTVTSGIGPHIQASFCSVFIDYDRDGYQDIYVVNDKFNSPNYMYKNNGDGTFTDATVSSGAGFYIDSMTAACDDYDQDGDLDIFVSNTPYDVNAVVNGNVLLNFDSETETFSNVAEEAGLIVGESCWGSLWLDYDNDSWNDLFISTLGSGFTLQVQDLFFINDGDGTFHDGSAQVGLGGTIDATYTAAMGDYDKDGYYDFITNNVAPSSANLMHNDGGTNKWLGVSVEGTISNKDGIGTWIECYAGGTKYTRYTFCGEDYMGQNSECELFGLGSINVVDSVKLQWLSGLVETYYTIPTNTHHHYIEGQSLVGVPATVTPSGNLTICPGDSIVLTAQESLEYLWSTGDTTQSIVVYSPGDFSVEVNNLFGIAQESGIIEVNEQVPPEVLVETLDVSCYNANDGSISLSIDEGEIDSVTWNIESTGPVLENLPQGMYSYVLTNSEGCVAEGEAEVGSPGEIIVELTATDVLCIGEMNGTASWEISGGTPGYDFELENGADPGALSVGTYSYVVTDSNGCVMEGEFAIGEPTAMELTINTTDALCFGDSTGTVAWDLSGGTPGYVVDFGSWDPGALPAGTYVVYTFDSNGCEVSGEFQIQEPEPIILDVVTTGQMENGNLGTAEVIIVGGTDPFLVEWNSSSSNATFIEELIAGFYLVEVTDSNGCTASFPFEIEFITSLDDEMAPTVFSIFPNPVSGFVTVHGIPTSGKSQIVLINQLGQDCDEWNLTNLSGDVSLDLSHQASGVYQLVFITETGTIETHQIIIQR